MLYTKNGSIPQPETDGTEGWIPAPDKPDCPEGKEVVWLNWEWVARDPKPADRPGYQWNWNHSEKAWVEGVWLTVSTEPPLEVVGDTVVLTGTALDISSTTLSGIETVE